MSTGPTSGVIASAAGTQFAQSSSTNDVERNSQDAASRNRQTKMLQEAEKAAGIGETTEEHQAEERDADGRRIWERSAQEETEQDQQQDPEVETKSIDPDGLSGNEIDLSG